MEGANSEPVVSGREAPYTVVYACDGGYWEHVYVSLYSLAINNPELQLDIRILAESPDAQFFDRVGELERRHGGLGVSWLPIHGAHFRDVPTGVVASRSTYYRLLLGSLLPDDIGRVLFIDGDTIVRGSIRSLLETELDGNVLAAAPQHSMRPEPLPPIDYAARIGLPAGSPYCNAGVLVADMDAWRALDVEARCLAYVAANCDAPGRLDYADQDTLNAVLVGRWKSLDPTFNFSEWTVPPWAFGLSAKSERAQRRAVIAHFAGHRKPWHGGTRHPFETEYWHYRMQTPYADRLTFLQSRATALFARLIRSARDHAVWSRVRRPAKTCGAGDAGAPLDGD